MQGIEIAIMIDYIKTQTENFTERAKNIEDVQYLFDSAYGFVRAIHYMGFK